MNISAYFPHLWIAGAAVVCLVEPVCAQQLTQITGITLEEREDGLEIILETADGSSPQFVQTPDEKTLFIDLVDAELNLPEEDDFQADNPAPGIESVTVTEEFAGSVAIVVVGSQTLPNVTTVPSQGLALSVTTAPGTAQTPPPPTPAPEEEIEIVVTGELEENPYYTPEVTTGTRTDTDILEVPQAIQVIPEEALDEQQVTTLSEALRNAASVNSGRSSSRTSALTPVIRGFETENILRNGLRDDTQRRSSAVANVERLEILKGPASVLYGQGNLGGSINVITKRPEDEPFYSSEASAGSEEQYRGELALTGPLNASQTLQYRLSSSFENAETFIDFEDIERRFFFAPTFEWLISDRTNLLLELEYFNEKTSGFAPELPAAGTVIDNPNGEVDLNVNLGEPSLTESNRTNTRAGYRFEHRFSDGWLLRNEFLAAFGRTPEGFGNVFVLPTALSTDQQTLNRFLAENPARENTYTLNTNVVGNFETGSIGHTLLLGVELSREEIEDTITITSFLPSINIFDPEYRPEDAVDVDVPLGDTEEQTDAIGIYFQDQIDLLDNLILVLGGRFDSADQTLNDLLAETEFSRTNEAFTPRVGLVYQPIEDVSVYFSYGRSFDPIAGQSFEGEPFDPEEGELFELGFKADLDEQLSLTLALYDLTRTNVTVLDPDNPTFQVQVGEQRSRGIELDVTGEILPGWNVIASYALTDAVIVEDEQFEAGNLLNNVPENAVSLWTTYDLQRGALQGLGFGAGLFFEGDREGDLDNSFTLPSFLRVDAALYYQRGALRAALNFYNLFDEDYFEGARSDVRVIPGAPFSVVGTLKWEF